MTQVNVILYNAWHKAFTVCVDVCYKFTIYKIYIKIASLNESPSRYDTGYAHYNLKYQLIIYIYTIVHHEVDQKNLFQRQFNTKFFIVYITTCLWPVL